MMCQPLLTPTTLVVGVQIVEQLGDHDQLGYAASYVNICQGAALSKYNVNVDPRGNINASDFKLGGFTIKYVIDQSNNFIPATFVVDSSETIYAEFSPEVATDDSCGTSDVTHEFDGQSVTPDPNYPGPILTVNYKNDSRVRSTTYYKLRVHYFGEDMCLLDDPEIANGDGGSHCVLPICLPTSVNH